MIGGKRKNCIFSFSDSPKFQGAFQSIYCFFCRSALYFYWVLKY